MFAVWFICACGFFVLGIAALILSSRLGGAERERYGDRYDES
jgi:hypothetical protein